jgi:hypothetical protein
MPGNLSIFERFSSVQNRRADPARRSRHASRRRSPRTGPNAEYAISIARCVK